MDKALAEEKADKRLEQVLQESLPQVARWRRGRWICSQRTAEFVAPFCPRINFNDAMSHVLGTIVKRLELYMDLALYKINILLLLYSTMAIPARGYCRSGTAIVEPLSTAITGNILTLNTLHRPWKLGFVMCINRGQRKTMLEVYGMLRKGFLNTWSQHTTTMSNSTPDLRNLCHTVSSRSFGHLMFFSSPHTNFVNAFVSTVSTFSWNWRASTHI